MTAGNGAARRSKQDFYGHSKNDDGNGSPELLRDHIQAVAERAASFAGAFSCDQQAYAAGILHDLGKYADQFQHRLVGAGERGRDHLPDPGRAIL